MQIDINLQVWVEYKAYYKESDRYNLEGKYFVLPTIVRPSEIDIYREGIAELLNRNGKVVTNVRICTISPTLAKRQMYIHNGVIEFAKDLNFEKI